MINKFRYFSTVLICCLGFVLISNQLRAQDTGKPALRSIAYYTVGGGVLGIGLGMAYWMLDPLAPSADLRGSVMQGYGVGVFLGFIFGALQLNKQAVFPYTEPQIPSEFQGNMQKLPSEGKSYLYAQFPEKPRAPEITLFNYQYSF